MKSYDMQQQLAVGRTGVETLKQAFGEEKPIEDLQDDMHMQQRGIDLHIPDYGFVEAKLDNHDSPYIFLETDAGHRAGACFASRADTIMFVFPVDRKIYSFPLCELQRWIADHYRVLKRSGKERIVTSRQGTRTWQVSGILADKESLLEEVPQAEVIPY